MAAAGSSVTASSTPVNHSALSMSQLNPRLAVVEIRPRDSRATTTPRPLTSPSRLPAPGAPYDAAEQRLIDHLRRSYPVLTPDDCLEALDAALDRRQAGHYLPLDDELIAVYRGAHLGDAAARAVRLYRAHVAQRQRAAKADPLQTAAAYLLEQCPDLGLAECKRIVVGVIQRYIHDDSESLTPHLDRREVSEALSLPAGPGEPSCEHGFIGACAECDGAGQAPGDLS